MAKDKSAALSANVQVFSRLKDLVRELETNERRLVRDFGPAKIELHIRGDEVAWFVAYSTAAAAVIAEETGGGA